VINLIASSYVGVKFVHRFNKRRDIDFGPEENRNPTAVRVHQWIAHVCLTTTVNISCSGKSYNNGQDKEGFKIPSGFFFNSTALGRVIDGVAGLVLVPANCLRFF